MQTIPLALLLLSLWQQKDPPPPPAIPLTAAYQSAHYDLKTNATKEQAMELLDFMELVYGTYMALLRPADPKAVLAKRSTLILYATHENYQASSPPANSGAYYNRQTRELVGWYHQVMMPGYFAHEGMHQFTDLTSQDYNLYPMWFSEGIADCFGNCEVRDQKLYMCVRNGAVARLRLAIIQKALRENTYWTLDKLLALSPADFARNYDLAYAQCWSFCHFLIAYPLHEDRSRQVPDGRYRRNIAAYYELLRAGKHTHASAWDAAFTGIDLKELEEQWKKYILTMDGGKYFGFKGHDISADEADKLKLQSGQGGVMMDDVTPGGVADKAGIKVGDIIVVFDGRALPRGGALNRIRTSLPDVPYDKPIALRIMRDGKGIDTKAIWESLKP